MGSTTRHPPTTAPPGAAASGTGLSDALTRLHAGDSAAFAEAYQTHLPALTAHVAARLTAGDRDVVADLVHDAFADALTDARLLGADVPASLRRLCDRACDRYLWSQRRYLTAAHTIYADQRDDQQPDPPAAQPGPVEALAALPDAERQVLNLRFLHGHTPQMTARLLDSGVRTVTYLERRACRRLRAQLINPAAPSAAPTPATVTGRA